MKKAIILIVLIIFGLTACSDKPIKVDDLISDNLSSYIEEGTSGLLHPNTNSSNDSLENEVPRDDGIDLDLSVMSSTMVYAEMYNVMYYPEKYVDKVFKITGFFDCYFDEEFNRDRYGIIVQDSTACCSQGIEIVLGNEYAKEDLPQIGEEVTIIAKLVENTTDNPYDFAVYYLVDVEIL